MTHKKININDMFQLIRSFKTVNPNWCIIYKGSSETINHLFLCVQSLWVFGRGFLTKDELGLIFSQTMMDWVQLNSIHDIMMISFKCFWEF